ncbi:DUF5058 family protein [uncultured Megasphaera sp.]|uniref:DUF5058 family protein n=1 Tax=uncultured Megasphaera sp. TaxID=165188 RepID=UPI00265A1AA4|nr:DUF5058 family protein [uncultured Megasphaera sp.]
MDYNSIINSPGLWAVSSLMIIVLLVSAGIYVKLALSEADKIGLERKRCIAGLRSAMITAIGPSLSPVIIAFALIAVIGAPTTWMRMNDVGAARTEIAVIALAAKVIGLDPQSPDFGLQGFMYGVWGMALNNFGWMFVTLLLTPGMSKYVAALNRKYNPAWIKLMLSGATVGLFAYLTSVQLVSLKPGLWCATAVSAVSMLAISRIFASHARLQEVALGISMLIGMFVTTAIFG